MLQCKINGVQKYQFLKQFHSRVSKHALFLKIPLNVSSWVLMTFGLHYQKFYWFVFIFGVNVSLGWIFLLSHFFGNEEVCKFGWLKDLTNIKFLCAFIFFQVKRLWI